MMFAKLSTLLAFSLFAVATPNSSGRAPTATVTFTAAPTATEPASQCNTGPIQCCNSVETAGSGSAATILGLLDIVVEDLNVSVGLTCNPITVIGVGSDSCDAHPVCCEDNSNGGLISIGCVPVDISL